MALITVGPDRDENQDKILVALTAVRMSNKLRLLELLGDPPSLDNVPPEFWVSAKNNEANALAIPLLAMFEDRANDIIQEFDLDIDPSLIELEARSFADARAEWTIDRNHKLIRQRIADKLDKTGPDTPKAELEASIGANALDVIARTETTQVMSAAAMFAAGAVTGSGQVTTLVWRLVPARHCELCPMLNMTTYPFWSQVVPTGPPAHPNCLCFIDVIAGDRRYAVSQGLAIAFDPPLDAVVAAARNVGISL